MPWKVPLITAAIHGAKSAIKRRSKSADERIVKADQEKDAAKRDIVELLDPRKEGGKTTLAGLGVIAAGSQLEPLIVGMRLAEQIPQGLTWVEWALYAVGVALVMVKR